ncbi:helix-turn-helix domain-containing protein [Streptomyces sp. VNUA116]|uniref:helix-turn-helix domain-containing protein n=1 Tax=Streptomyces sp. VNUA116 TaxID=3062449 RepID=UPI002674AA2A|nr:helix-turn-helix domain-containing protein [Streptomyces sp. VNUA116]WKU48833.1 helix-turn-helix domain-containing protein [Streptomyces sp. VNUA116]
MTDESSFGARLKALRLERGLSQASLAGKEISTGYLSRLESGARQPTERVITYLAGQLGVDRMAFDALPAAGTPTGGGSALARTLSIAASCADDEPVEDLIDTVATADEEDPQLRWQALWLIARFWHSKGERTEELACLEKLAEVADGLGLPALQCRSRTQLARSLRSAGQVARALELAESAYHTAKDSGLSVSDTGTALLALVSAEAEAGRLADARAHSLELVALVEGGPDALRAEALWSAATVCSRQGDDEAVHEYLGQAMQALDSRADPILWARLRLAAASLYLQSRPALTEEARICLAQAETALLLIGTPVQQQELLVLQAHLAFEEGRYADARAAHDQLDFDNLVLTYRDRIRLQTLDSLLLIVEGHEQEGRARLKQLGEEARRASNMDLAAEIWRVLAETLENAAQAGTADRR